MLYATPLGTIQGLGSFNPMNTTMNDAPEKLTTLISTVLSLITVGVGIFFVLYFATAGLQFVTAGADKGKLDQARDKMTTSIIGLVLTITSYAIVGFIGSVFGFDILNPKATLGLP